MALRLIKILPPREFTFHNEIINKDDVIDYWTEINDGKTIIHLLVDVELTETVLQDFETSFSGSEDYRIVLFPVAATLPPQPSGDEEETEEIPDENNQNEKRVHRISREELYEDIKEVVDVSWVYFVLIALSCVVAANGLIRDSAAMVIGAMVIAPILGPNVGLALATTLGDKWLLKRSMRSIIYGFSLGLSLSIMMGILLDINPDVYEINSRTTVSFADIALGLAAGIAGCLSFTRGISAAVIGVMVAVALLPPMVATGLLLGSGMNELAMGAALLTVT